MSPSTDRVKPLKDRRLSAAIPGATSILSWVYIGRLSVATVVFVVAAFSFTRVPAGVIVVLSVAALLSLFVTGASVFLSHVRKDPPSPAFLYGQSLFDIALITTVVWVTGGVSSDFPSLYVLVIAASALTMHQRGTLIVTLAAAASYFTLGILSLPIQWLPVILQIVVFFAVALATGWLAGRVRVVGEQRKQLEQEVQRLRLEASDILREISGGILTVDGDGALVYANESAQNLLAFSAPPLVSKPFLDFLRHRSQELWMAIAATHRDGRQVRAEGTVTLGNRRFPIGVTTTPHVLDESGPPSVTAIFTDISDQKRLSELNVRNERLEAVAALSASLAHEIKNPLASIRSSVEQLGRSHRADDDERFLTELVVRESDRLSRLLSEFLDFTRVRVAEAQTVDIQNVAVMAVELVREHPDCSRDAVIEVCGSSTRVEGDEDLLHRIVVNLVLNALQATGSNARIKVTTDQVRARDLPTGVSSDKSVVLRVEDNGPGIPEHLLRNLFDPFVTGREGGSGLGLAIVQRAVQAHNGLVFVDSDPGAGTTFSVYLPSPKHNEVAA
jgi:two-component system sensor histidine kinase PilS (NtrC family)